MPLVRRALIAASIAALGLCAASASAASVGNVSVSGSTVHVSGSAGSNPVTWSVTPSANQVTIGVSGGHVLSNSGGCATGSGTSTITCTGLTSGWDLSVVLTATASQTVDVLGSFAVNTQIVGGSGNDSLSGGTGNDRLSGMAGEDVLVGEGGIDTADYSVATEPGRTQGITVSLDDVKNDGSSTDDGPGVGGLGGDDVRSDVENVLGTERADTLAGNSAANLLSGYGGNDTLTGNAGSDRMQGSRGNDTLNAEDGEADAEVNCNNSDGSQDEQPNTVHYDAGKDSPVNCGELGPGGTSPANGSSGTSAGTRALKALPSSGSWTVPADFAPRRNPSARKGKTAWLFTEYKELRNAARAADVPVKLYPEWVSSRRAPADQRVGLSDGDIIAIRNASGANIAGATLPATASAPAKAWVLVYDEAADLKPGQCPYVGPVSNVDNDTLAEKLFGAPLSDAVETLKKRKCTYTLSTRYADSSNGVAEVEHVRVRKTGVGRYVVRLSVKVPVPSLSLVLGAPTTDRFGPTFSADTGRLPFSPVTRVRISAQALQSTTGLPAGAGTVYTISGKDGVLDSATATAPGPVNLVFTLPRSAGKELRVNARLAGTDAVGDYVLLGEKKVQAFVGGSTFTTIDGRCLALDREDAWAPTRCAAKTKAEHAAGTSLCSNYGEDINFDCAYTRRVARTLVGEPGSAIVPSTRDRALDVCRQAKTSWSGGAVNAGEFRGCENTEARDLLVKAFGIEPVTVSSGLASTANYWFRARVDATDVPAAAVAGGAYSVGTAPAVQLPVGGSLLALRIQGKVWFDASHYVNGLINLDGGTLINLDGGTLINLDGGTLTSDRGLGFDVFDAAMLARFTPGVLEGSVLYDAAGVARSVSSPPQLVASRQRLINLDGGTLISDMGGCLITKVTGAGLLGKVK